MLRYLTKFLFLILLSQSFSFECATLKLDNISSERALTTLKALGYNTVEHTNVYMDDIKLNTLSPMDETDTTNDIFIIDIPDYDNYSLDNLDTSENDEENAFTQYLSGTSMSNPTQSDPIERILVCYDPNQIEKYRNFLDILYNKLDAPAKQILIEALIVEINSDAVKDQGLALEYLNQANGLNLSTPTNDGSPLSLIYSESDFSELLIDVETGEIFSNSLDDIFKVKLNALINDKSAEILSKPSVLVLDGRQARIQVGQQIPISKLPISAFSGDEILIPDIEYIPVGIVLNLKPRISNDLKSVSMQVETIITETEELTSGVLEAPIINNRKVESHVKVLNNTPFIIGGLISNKKSDQEGRIPILSKIPLIGKLFSWSTKQSIKKEVIVVITPHIIDNNDANFSRVIPQDESIFDSFGNILFPNSYRLKESDIYDLNFITESNYLNTIKKNAQEIIDSSTKKELIALSNKILNNYIPGEQIITRRMLYDVIEKQNYYKVINSEKIIFFNNDKDYGVDFLKNYHNTINNPKKGIVLQVSKNNNINNSFFRPGVNVKEIDLNDNYNYKELLKNEWEKDGDFYPILITNKKELKRLYEILIMQEVLKLNSSLELTIKEFKRGLEIQFPAKDLISSNSFVIDENVAKYFFETNFYYDSFEKEFKSKTNDLLD
jgi:general secretion pathway protein D